MLKCQRKVYPKWKQNQNSSILKTAHFNRTEILPPSYFLKQKCWQNIYIFWSVSFWRSLCVLMEYGAAKVILTVWGWVLCFFWVEAPMGLPRLTWYFLNGEIIPLKKKTQTPPQIVVTLTQKAALSWTVKKYNKNQRGVRWERVINQKLMSTAYSWQSPKHHMKDRDEGKGRLSRNKGAYYMWGMNQEWKSQVFSAGHIRCLLLFVLTRTNWSQTGWEGRATF